jgi:hypothetical protein
VHKPGIDKQTTLAIKEIARITGWLRRRYPSLSDSDIFDAVAWGGTQPVLVATALSRMHRSRSRPVDLERPRKG